jgi:hypothetical protein
LEEWEDEFHAPEMGTWEFVGTLETSEFDFRGSKDLALRRFFYIIGNL